MGDDCNRMSFQLISMLRVLIDHAEAQSKGRKEIMKSIDNISTELKHSNDSIKTELMNLNKSIASLTSSIDNLRQVLINQRASSNEALSHHQIQPEAYARPNNVIGPGNTQPNMSSITPIDTLNITVNIEQSPIIPPPSIPSRRTVIPLFSSPPSNMTNEEIEVLANIIAQALEHPEHRL